MKRKGKCGAKRKTSKRDDRRLTEFFRKDCRKTAVDLARELAETGVHVTPMTVRRLREAGRPARKPVKKQLLPMAMKAKRLAWAKKRCLNLDTFPFIKPVKKELGDGFDIMYIRMNSEHDGFRIVFDPFMPEENVIEIDGIKLDAFDFGKNMER